MGAWRLTTVAALALGLAACSAAGGHLAPAKTSVAGTAPGAYPAPSTFVASNLVGTATVFQLFSTAGGNLEHDVTTDALPRGVGPSGLSDLHVGVRGHDLFWTSVDDSNLASTGSVVQSPLTGRPSRIVATGVEALPSPDGVLLFVVEHSLLGGREFSGFEVVDLRTAAVTPLPNLPPPRASETFSWLPDSHTVLAFYPGTSGKCAGPAACVVVPIDPTPAAWTISAAKPARGWTQVPISGAGLAGEDIVVLGPGGLPGTVAATAENKTSEMLTVSVTGTVRIVANARASGLCNVVDHTGTNFLCQTHDGLAIESFAHPHPHLIGHDTVASYGFSWW